MTTGGATGRAGTGTATLATVGVGAAPGLGAGAGFFAATGAGDGFGSAITALAAGIFAGGLAALAGTDLLATTVFDKGAFFAGDRVAEGRSGADVFFFTGAALFTAGFLATTGFLLAVLVLWGALLAADVLTVSPRDGRLSLTRKARWG